MAFQFKVQLKDIDDPPVWRRLSVPDQFSFLRFHKVIQAAFGWENRHLFQFSPGGFNSAPIIGVPDPDLDEMSVLDSKKIKLNKIFTLPEQEFSYTYDLGDDWVHTILLEEITGEKLLRADCIAGQGNCPPEDCGGSRGYASLKGIMSDPKHPEYKEMKEWLGVSRVKNWDAGHFSLDRAHYTVGRM